MGKKLEIFRKNLSAQFAVELYPKMGDGCA